jgi:hypothetical protein
MNKGVRLMKRLTIAIMGVLATAAMGLAGPATATPTGGSPAADTVKWLQEQGYAVRLKGIPSGPLSQCTATGIHGLRDSTDQSRFTTVYVDISCNTST